MPHLAEWIKDHVVEWWGDIIHILTNNTEGTPQLSQNELALTIFMLIVLLLTNVFLVAIMIKRLPLLWLDKSLLMREMFFAFLFAVTLYSFYAQVPVSFYLRMFIYNGLLVSGILVIITVIRENFMSEREVEEERQRQLERDSYDN